MTYSIGFSGQFWEGGGGLPRVSIMLQNLNPPFGSVPTPAGSL
jgi:hypothetical protein